MAVTAEQYKQALAQAQARYGRGPITGRAGTESARDAAVRAANIATGYGSSTALQTFPVNAAPQPRKTASGGGKAGGSSSSPFKLKTSSTRPANPNANVTTPTSVGGYYNPNQNVTTPTSVEDPSQNIRSPSAAGTFLPVMTSPSSAGTFQPNPTTPTSLGGMMSSTFPGRPAIPSPSNPWIQMNHPRTGGLIVPPGINQNIAPQAATGVTQGSPLFPINAVRPGVPGTNTGIGGNALDRGLNAIGSNFIGW